MKMVWIMTMNKAPRVQLTNPCQGQCQERRSPPKEHRVENQKSHSSKRYLHCNTVLKCWCHGNSYKLLWAQLWARHFTLAVPLSIQVCKWVPANLNVWG